MTSMITDEGRAFFEQALGMLVAMDNHAHAEGIERWWTN